MSCLPDRITTWAWLKRAGTAMSIGLWLCFAAGCGGAGDGPELHPVSGTVTLDGTPIEKGQILFRKLEGDQKAYAAPIVAGAYELAAEAGAMSVEITASRLLPGQFDTSNETPEPVGIMYVPSRYNSESELKAEVAAGKSNEIPFVLTTD